jgi:hypothetical protein
MLTFCNTFIISIYIILVGVSAMPRFSSATRRETAGPERLLQARLPGDVVKSLRLLAVERDTTVKALLTEIVRDYVDRQRSAGGRRG